MSLNWSFSRVKNWQDVCFEGPEDNRTMKKDTECLIFSTMAVGLGEITKKNIKE